MPNLHNNFFTADRSVTGVGLSAARCTLPPAVQGHDTIFFFVSKYNGARQCIAKVVNRYADLPMRIQVCVAFFAFFLSSFLRLAENKRRKILTGFEAPHVGAPMTLSAHQERCHGLGLAAIQHDESYFLS